MNLNEERKAPLRGKDLSTKREMVVQYISATAKSVSQSSQAMFCFFPPEVKRAYPMTVVGVLKCGDDSPRESPE